MPGTPLEAFRKLTSMQPLTEGPLSAASVSLDLDTAGQVPDEASKKPKRPMDVLAAELAKGNIHEYLKKAQLPQEPSHRIDPLSVLGATGSATAKAVGTLADKPGSPAAAFAFAKELGHSLTSPSSEQSSVSHEIEQRTGQPLPGGGFSRLALDAAMDVGNAVDPATLLKGALGAGAVVGAAKLAEHAPEIGARVGGRLGHAIADEAGVLRLGKVSDELLPEGEKLVDTVVPRTAEKVPGQGVVQDAIADGGIFPPEKVANGMQPPTMAKLDHDDELMHPFLEKHTDVDKKELKDIFFEADNFWDHRRMGLTWEQANKLADDTNVTINLPKGTALNQEQTLALRSKAMGLLNNAQEIGGELMDIEHLAQTDLPALGALAEKYNVKGVDGLKAVREEAWLKAKAGLQAMSGARSEAGRTLNSYRQLRAARAMGDDEFIRQSLTKGALPDQVYSALNTMPTQVDKYKFLRSLTQPDAQDIWRWYYVSNLLSGPVTHIRNVFGNTTRLLSELAATQAAPLLGNSVGERAYWGEGLKQAAGAYAGLKPAFEKASFMFKNGFSKDMAYAFADSAPEVMGGKLVPNMIGRSLNAADEFFRTIGTTMSLHRMAYADAVKKGLTGDALLNHAAQLVDNPSVDLMKAAAKEGTELVFRQPAGKGTKWIRRGQNLLDEAGKSVGDTLNQLGDKMVASDYKAIRAVGRTIDTGSFLSGLAKMPLGTFVMPFISTPVNILRAGTHFSPYGIVKGAMTGGRAGTQMAARGAVGTGMLAYAAFMAWEGNLTGQGPSDPRERDQFFAEGKLPNAVKIGDRWVSYQQFAPLAFPLAMVANAVETYKQAPDKQVAGPELAGQVLAKTAKSVLDQSYLSGIMGLVGAVGDWARKGDQYLGRTVTGFVPASGAMRTVRNAMDNSLRDPAGVTENVEAALPGLSTKVPARLDYAGRTIRKPGNMVQRALSPIDTNVERPDTTRRALVASDTYYQKPPQTLRGEQGEKNILTRDEGVTLGKTYGALMEQELGKLARDPHFMALPLEQRRTQIEQLKRELASQVRDYFRAQHAQTPR